MRLVVDASITVRLLSNRDTDDLLRKRFSAPRVLHAPHLLDAEVASAIRGLLIGGKIPENRANEMLTDFAELRIVRHPMTAHLGRIIELRNNVSAYDACYLTLAESLGTSLLTLDERLAKAVGHRAEVWVYG